MNKHSLTEKNAGNFGPCLRCFKIRFERGDNKHGLVTREIDYFERQHRTKDNYSIFSDFRTKNFPNATNPIEYGVQYSVFLIPISGENVTYKDCLDYMKKNKYLLVGPSIFPLLRREYVAFKNLPFNKWLMSPDVEKNCFEGLSPCMNIQGEDGVKEKYISIQPTLCKSTFNKNYVLICIQKSE